MGKPTEVNPQVRMVKIVSRLPVYLQSRWRKKAYEARESRDSYMRFTEMVEFMERVSDEACDPVFGKIDAPRKPDAQRKPDKGGLWGKSASRFNVQVEDKKTA